MCVTVGVGPLYLREWQDISEASQYWARVNDLVEAGQNVEGMPTWHAPLPSERATHASTHTHTGCRASSPENLGLTVEGDMCPVFDRLRDFALLGQPLGMQSGYIPDAAITCSSFWGGGGCVCVWVGVGMGMGVGVRVVVGVGEYGCGCLTLHTTT